MQRARKSCYYGTVSCDGYYGSLIVSPATSTIPANSYVEQLSADGQYSDGSTPPVGASWSSSNSGTATVDSSGNVTAVFAGQVTITATASLPQEGSYYGYNPSCATLQTNGNFSGTATVTLGDTTPTITGISPSDWQAGATTAVTFSGQSFGTSAPTLGFSPGSGISYTLTGYNDTVIYANITVNASTPNEVVNITVTSNGYSGRPFLPEGDGQSAQSAPTNAGIYHTLNYTEITVIGWLNPNAITLPGGENASLQSDLENAYTCAADVVLWAGNQAYDLQSAADRAYASAFLLQHSGNLPPPATTLTPSPSAWIANNRNNYRLANDYGGKTGTFQVGIAPDPCGTNLPGPISDWLSAAEASPYNGATGTSPSGQAYQLAEGRLGNMGQAVNQTLNGHTSPWIFSTIEFTPSGTPTYSDISAFPSFSVYKNGVFQYTVGQIDWTWFADSGASYQRLPSQIP